jgi:hypothetical protein
MGHFAPGTKKWGAGVCVDVVSLAINGSGESSAAVPMNAPGTIEA